MAAARTRAVTRASAPRSAGSTTWIPRCAPIARARWIAWAASSEPIETTVTSPPCRSVSCRASSSPYSSPGSSIPSTPERTTRWSGPRVVSLGTYFVHTTTSIDGSLPAGSRRGGARYGLPVSDRPARSLDGVLVADFSRVLAGPLATMILGDLGAEIIKVEHPDGGDDTRRWGPPWAPDGESSYYLVLNRNKRSVALDLKDPEDLAAATDLARRADVVIENFRPGVTGRFGLDEPTVRAANPGVVYCSILGIGRGDVAGYDFLAQAVGGLMSITGDPDGEPRKVGVALVDVMAGLHATIGIVAALRHRERTGEGQLVEVDLLSTTLFALANQASGYLTAGVVPGRMGNRHPSIAPYATLATADAPLVIAVGNDGQFRTLCRSLGDEGLADDPRYAY